MVKVSKGTTNGTCKQSNDPDSKNNQKRMKTSMDSADEWSVDSLGDSSKMSKERPISHASDEGKFRFLSRRRVVRRGRNSIVTILYVINAFGKP